MIKRTRDDMATKYEEKTELTSARRNTKGQVAVEYVILLAVGVLIASLIVSLVVSRDSESPGFLISKWRQLIELIGQDVIDP